MKNLVQVIALTAFVSGGKEIMPGPALVSADAVARLVEKNYIEPPDGALTEAQLQVDSGATGSTPNGPFPDAFEAVATIVSTQKSILRHSDENGEQFIMRLIDEGTEAIAELSAIKSAPSGRGQTSPLEALYALGEDVLDSLVKGGFVTLEAIENASNKDLEALPGIGEATVKKIRALLK